MYLFSKLDMIRQRNTIRRLIQAQRSNLTQQQLVQTSKKVCRKLSSSFAFLQSQRIAFYFAHKGEIDPIFSLENAQSQGKECYIPILHPLKHNRLWFGRYHLGDKLKRNTFGILEPCIDNVEIVAPWSLDLVVTPLVAFDTKGCRLGMGGGFYDRTFAFKTHTKRHSPILIGVGHEFQKVDNMEKQQWDICLDMAITEKSLLTFD